MFSQIFFVYGVIIIGRSVVGFDLNDTMRIVSRCYRSTLENRKSPRTIDTRISYRTHDPLIDVKNSIDEDDIMQVSNLVRCVEICSESHVEDRHFNNSGYGGGNNVTYVGGFIQNLMPEFIQHILTVASLATDYAGWRPHPFHLGIRCVEFLTYGPGTELLLHKDTNSVYTIVVMMSDTNFEGGDFVIKTKTSLPGHSVNNSEQLLQHRKPRRRDALLFDSNIEHGVEPITRGIRQVLVFELWAYEDVTAASLRPSPKEEKIATPLILRLTPPHVLVKKDGIIIDLNVGLLIIISVLCGILIGTYASSRISNIL